MAKSTNNEAGAKRKYNPHRVRRTVRVLLGKKNKRTTFNRYPNRYYSHVYIDRQLSESIAFLAKANRQSRMAVVDQVLRIGLSRILGDAIVESNRRQAAMRNEGLPPTPTPLVREFIRQARKRGVELGDFF